MIDTDLIFSTIINASYYALSAYLFPSLCSSVGLAAAIGAILPFANNIIENFFKKLDFDYPLIALGITLYLVKLFFDVKWSSLILMALVANAIQYFTTPVVMGVGVMFYIGYLACFPNQPFHNAEPVAPQLLPLEF